MANIDGLGHHPGSQLRQNDRSPTPIHQKSGKLHLLKAVHGHRQKLKKRKRKKKPKENHTRKQMKIVIKLTL